VLTLFTTPVVYLYFDRLATRFGKTKPIEDDSVARPSAGSGPNSAPEIGT